MALVTIPYTEVINIHSAHTEADYQLWVATPRAGVMSMAPAPQGVLYVLDANLAFGTAVEMTRLMSELYGELPPLLIVGIAYETSSPSIQSEMRSRDFTPTVDSGFGSMAFPGATLPEGRRLGRAHQFLQFLTEEVKPIIERRYAVAEKPATLFGSSLGGLFVLYALLERPDAFGAYIAVSPALWWDDRLLLTRDRGISHEVRKGKVFLAVGAEEERADIPALAAFKMVSNVREFERQLRARNDESLIATTFVAEGESHTTVIPAALTRALRGIYPPMKPAWMP